MDPFCRIPRRYDRQILYDKTPETTILAIGDFAAGYAASFLSA